MGGLFQQLLAFIELASQGKLVDFEVCILSQSNVGDPVSSFAELLFQEMYFELESEVFFLNPVDDLRIVSQGRPSACIADLHFLVHEESSGSLAR